MERGGRSAGWLQRISEAAAACMDNGALDMHGAACWLRGAARIAAFIQLTHAMAASNLNAASGLDSGDCWEGFFLRLP